MVFVTERQSKSSYWTPCPVMVADTLCKILFFNNLLQQLTFENTFNNFNYNTARESGRRRTEEKYCNTDFHNDVKIKNRHVLLATSITCKFHEWFSNKTLGKTLTYFLWIIDCMGYTQGKNYCEETFSMFCHQVKRFCSWH